MLSTQAWYTFILVLVVNMDFSQTIFARWAIAVTALPNPCVQFSIKGEVAGDGGTKVGEILHHLKGVVINGDAWDATDVLAYDFGLLKTDSKTKFSTCMCEPADE